METQNNAPYSALYKYYDYLMRDYPYDKILAYVTPLLGAGGRGLELACGTGRFAVALSKAGHDMSASDISPGMLNAAVRRAEENGLRIMFCIEDINRFKPKNNLDFAVSFTDGLNYAASEKKLSALFAAISASLKRGGKFIFDVSTPYKAEHVLADRLFFEDEGDLAYFWQNSYRSGRVGMRLTFFERRGTLYERFDESAVQHFYQTPRILELLKNAGFRAFALDCETFKAPRKRSERLLFIAERL